MKFSGRYLSRVVAFLSAIDFISILNSTQAITLFCLFAQRERLKLIEGDAARVVAHYFVQLLQHPKLYAYAVVQEHIAPPSSQAYLVQQLLHLIFLGGGAIVQWHVVLAALREPADGVVIAHHYLNLYLIFGYSEIKCFK